MGMQAMHTVVCTMELTLIVCSMGALTSRAAGVHMLRHLVLRRAALCLFCDRVVELCVPVAYQDRFQLLSSTVGSVCTRLTWLLMLCGVQTCVVCLCQLVYAA